MRRINPTPRDEIAEMLRTMPSAWRRQYRTGRDTLARNGGPVLPDVPTPEQAMLIIANTAGGNADADKPSGDQPVPASVRDAAMKGLRLSYAHNYGGWEFFGIARAIQLALVSSVPMRTRQRMVRYLESHEKDKAGRNFGNDANPSNGYMAWLNWGGDPALAWNRQSGIRRATYGGNMRRKNPRYSVVATTPGYPILDVVKATYSSLDEAQEAVTLGPEHAHKPWRKHGREYEWTGAPNIWAKPARQNPGNVAAFYAVFKDGDMDGPVQGFTGVRMSALGPNGLKWARPQREFAVATANRINQAVAKADKSNPAANDEAIADVVAAYANMKFAMNIPNKFMETVGGRRNAEGDYLMPTPGAAAVMEVLQAQSSAALSTWHHFTSAVEKVTRGVSADRALDAILRKHLKGEPDTWRAELPLVAADIIANKALRKSMVSTILLLKKYSNALVPPGETPCPRCGGVGFLPQFLHVEQGRCFRCQGDGIKPKYRR